jgi:hypothetical protein
MNEWGSLRARPIPSGAHDPGFTSGTLVLLHPLPRWSGKVATRAKEIEQGNWVAAALSIAAAGTTASQSAASAAAVAATHS